MRFGRWAAAGTHSQKYAASDPFSFLSSRARRALLMADSILPRWRTMPGSAEEAPDGPGVEARDAGGIEARERLPEVLTLAAGS
jgi:hypothetical protein